MKKNLFMVLVGVLFFVNSPIIANALDKIKVKNETEFLKALGSNRVIILQEGCELNLSKVLEFSDALSDLGIKDAENDNCGNLRYNSVFDGVELELANLHNLVIKGEGENRPKIVVDPRYAYVLSFLNCKNITLQYLEIGHTDIGYCSGGVLNFVSCEDVKVDDCDMYGCGTEGITLNKVNSFICTNSIVRDCSYSIMTINNSFLVKFSDCSFYRNQEYGLININQNTANVRFFKCNFTENKGTLFLLDTKVDMVKCEINHKTGDLGDTEFINETDCNWQSNITAQSLSTPKEENTQIFYHYYKGKIDDKEAYLAYALQNKVIIGELMFPDGSDTEILPVYGMIYLDGEILFNVYNSVEKTYIRKSFVAKIVGKTLDCFDDFSQSEFSLRVCKDTPRYALDRVEGAFASPFVKNSIYYFKADYRELAGMYTYNYYNANLQKSGQIDIRRSAENFDDITFNIDCITNGNQALVKGETVLQGNKLLYHLKYGNCNYKFEVLFYNGFLVIRGIEGTPFGCFGANATIEGIYVAVPSVG